MSGITTPTGNLSYGFDGDGARATVQSPSGFTDYVYDNQGRISGVGQLSGSVFTAQVSYTYDSAGQLSLISRASGTTSAYSYDLQGRAVRIAHGQGVSVTPTLSYDYSYDLAGRRTCITKQNGSSVFYSYDKAGKLVKESYSPSGRVITYGYDAVGNRLTKTDSADPMFAGTASNYVYTYDTGGHQIFCVSGLSSRRLTGDEDTNQENHYQDQFIDHGRIDPTLPDRYGQWGGAPHGAPPFASTRSPAGA